MVSARLDPAPILALVAGRSDREISDRIGVSRRTVWRWRQGVTLVYPATADRVAVRLGLHPANVWGDDWWTQPVNGPSEVRCVGCGRPVDTNEVHQGHEPGCEFAAGLTDRCGCDRPAHPECCDC